MESAEEGEKKIIASIRQRTSLIKQSFTCFYLISLSLFLFSINDTILFLFCCNLVNVRV